MPKLQHGRLVEIRIDEVNAGRTFYMARDFSIYPLLGSSRSAGRLKTRGNLEEFEQPYEQRFRSKKAIKVH